MVQNILRAWACSMHLCRSGARPMCQRMCLVQFNDKLTECQIVLVAIKLYNQTTHKQVDLKTKPVLRQSYH